MFCRICREGLHDVNYDLETEPSGNADPSTRGGQRTQDAPADVNIPATASTSAAAGDGAGSQPSSSSSKRPNRPKRPKRPGLDVDIDTDIDEGGGCTAAPFNLQQSLAHLPPLVARHPTAENPLLAPCQCTGTMAFVHYLCVEQWRMRSRHPGAKNGLNCETCGGVYSLPPPPSRPARGHDGPGGGNVMAEDDWLDAMPPHVLAALRRPHPAWQLGAAVVRRRWLRPVVPVLVSPLVALYCRARRTLKKRGVSRRRWACSLCRRRARWKCVRCLRSYYCSRQCQNVSWHIVHKHVCYKPVRFWWSVAVYAVIILLTVPGIMEVRLDPLRSLPVRCAIICSGSFVARTPLSKRDQNFPVYDAMVTLVPINFVALGIVAGGLASALKRATGADVRGRILEVVVVAQTALLTCVTSGLVQGFFGDPGRCWGAFAPTEEEGELQGPVEGDIPGWAHESLEGDIPGWAREGPEGDIEGWAREGPASRGPHPPLPVPLLNALLVDLPLRQIRLWYLKWDFALSKLGPVSHRFLCVPTPDGNMDYASVGCSPSTRNINPQFYLEEAAGGRCASDLSLAMGVWIAALGVLLLGSLWRQFRGMRRGGDARVGERQRRGRRQHAHQD